MKKGFFGYNVSEVDVVISALREENESLNATITTLKTQIKNSVSSNGAKANLLEADLKQNEENLKKINDEKNELISQISSLSMESEILNQQNAELLTQMEQLHMQNEDLNRQVSELRTQMIELTAQGINVDTSVMDALQSQLDAEKQHKAELEQALINKLEELEYAMEELAVTTSDLEETKAKLEVTSTDLEKEQAQIGISESAYESLKEEAEIIKASFKSVTVELENTKALLDQKAKDANQSQAEIDSLKSQLESACAKNTEQAEKLTAIGSYADDYNNLKEMLVSTCASLNEKTIELEKAHKEIEQMKNELAIAKVAVDEQAKMKATEKKQLANINQASEISFQAYYDMSKMRNEVVEYMHEQMKEYYQLVNDNSVKMRGAFEQRQNEYNQMIRDFFTKASEFRANLSNIDVEYSNMTDYSLNIDKISNRMNDIMDNFIEESSAYLKKKEDAFKPEEDRSYEDKNPHIRTEEISKKPIVFKISG
ncbi:MAG: hypothetical protein K0S47_53 [Herbinix sp.]|jgi:chromosome segregation ATPase|nr:hypothetical protein [Herbinix sp.]